MYTDRLKLMFSHASLQLLLALWLLGWGLLIASHNAHLLWLAPLGILAQMLNEYSTHRFLFHWPAPRSQFWFDVLYRVHYGHHDCPRQTGVVLCAGVVCHADGVDPRLISARTRLGSRYGITDKEIARASAATI